MSHRVDFLAHASAAIERIDQALAKLRTDSVSLMGEMTRHQRNLVEENLLILDRHHSNVMDAYRDMKQASPDALPERWIHFLGHYDDYLKAVECMKAECGPDTGEGACASTVVRRPRRSGRVLAIHEAQAERFRG